MLADATSHSRLRTCELFPTVSDKPDLMSSLLAVRVSENHAAAGISNTTDSISTTAVDIVICVCAVSADLAVIVVTWRRTYRLWREASRQGESSPLMSIVLRDGQYDDITLVDSQLSAFATRYSVFCVSWVRRLLDSQFF